jgi:teichuronic acid biosynthesis protein TuaE
MCIKINKRSIPQLFLYMTIIFAFPNAYVMSVEIGAIHLFPYRYFLMVMYLIFIAAIFSNNGRLNVSHIKLKLYLQFFALWLGYALLSITWAADKIAVLKNIIFLFTGVSIVFISVYYLYNLNYLKWLYYLLLFIFIAQLPIGIWEIITLNHLQHSGMFEVTNVLESFMPSVFFRNPNDYACYIVLTIPMILAWVHYYPKVIGRVLGIIIMVVGLFVLIMTVSRSCYIALLMGFAFWFIFLLPRKEKIKTLSIGVAICILIILAFPEQIKSSLFSVENAKTSLSVITSQEDDTDSIGVRKNLIKNALYFTAQSAGFGVGAGNAEYYMENYKIYPVGNTTNVHNWWVEILLNYGVLIFVGYVILYVALLVNLWRAYRIIINRTEKMICEALLVGLVSFPMASITSSSIVAFDPQWIFFGFVLAFLNYFRNTTSVKKSKCIF